MLNPSTLYDQDGKRLYLTQDERQAFMAEARKLEPPQRTFCALLHDSGCRISEALQLPIGRIDLQTRSVTFETLKQRRKKVFRSVPLPDDSLDLLDVVHGVRFAGKGKDYLAPSSRVWAFSRPTAWRIVKGVMIRANIEDGAHRSPKGLRHGFGINAVLSGVPITKLQRWMGHSKLETTAIYLDAVGAEERQLAARMWN